MFSQKFYKPFLIILFLAIILCLAGCKVAPETNADETTIKFAQAKTISDPTWVKIQQAITKATTGREDVLAFLIYNVTINKVEYSPDGNLALVWIEMVDKTTGEILPGEPGLVIGKKGADGAWTVVLQSDSTYAAELQAIPDSMLSADMKAQYMPGEQQVSKSSVVYSGYRLPWGNGKTVRLTGSIGHVFTYKSCPSTCLYAFDFANGTEFPIAAAKAGTVKYAEWRYADGNTSNANYLVIQDTTTTPTTYMVYYHLAQNSIPDALRVVGARVYQGQYLANADDTGASSGHHLHFMVHTSSTTVWGTSVDIVFDEVTVNGGRPRLCSEAASFPAYGTQCMPGDRYVSKNGDNEVPTGGLTVPEADSVITSPTLSVSGWMMDDFLVSSGQLYYKTSGDWTAIGDPIKETKFTTSINLCDKSIPNGKFYLSLQVTDSSGSLSSLDKAAIQVDKEYSCSNQAPVCTVGESQAALFSAADYQGSCQVLELGDYASLDALTVKNNETRSAQLGSNVSLLLYADPDFGGTEEIFQNGDNDLSNNIVGALNVGSVRVVNKITPPLVPTLTLPTDATSEDGITLVWSTEENVETRAALTGPNNYSQTLDYQAGGTWSVGLLAAGDYTLTVEARNIAGNTTISEEFTILKPVALPVVTLTALPEQVDANTFSLAWTVDSGADTIDHFEIQQHADGGDWADMELQPAASARDTVFTGELGHTYGFRIRGVTAAGKAVDWSETAEVTTTTVAGCVGDAYEGTTPGDDEVGSAAPLTIGTSQTHNWCPAGDVDWVAFQATKGQILRLTTAPVGANSAASELLYDTDGVTLLGEYHPADSSSEASMDWTVPVDGVYYVKYSPVVADISGTDTNYTVKIEQQNTVQTIPVVCGSTAIPALLGGAYLLVSKKVQKKKASKRAGWN
jgi:murein DD-endopeptidase MepM/ murein hydrolase activator NlpD